MKLEVKIISTSLLAIALLFTSCRKEDMEFIETPPEDVLQPNSSIADLMLRTAMNDGSRDNILDLANCFSIKFPIAVSANSIDIQISNEADYDMVESIFDDDYTDVNNLDITFPITIVNSDFSEDTLDSMSQLMARADNCNGENVADSDIECIDFMYPFSASKFNTNNQIISTDTFTNDKELYNFIESIDLNDIVSIDFPINVQLSDSSPLEINSLSELEITIINEQNACDEDDDYDYDDDDCDDCTQELLENFLTGCQNWYTDKVRQDDFDYNTIYDGYDFNFSTDGTVTAAWNMTTATGTWSTSGTGNNMFVLINIPALPFCNNNWKLQEINTSNLTKIDLILNTEDRLRYRNTCN